MNTITNVPRSTWDRMEMIRLQPNPTNTLHVNVAEIVTTKSAAVLQTDYDDMNIPNTAMPTIADAVDISVRHRACQTTFTEVHLYGGADFVFDSDEHVTV